MSNIKPIDGVQVRALSTPWVLSLGLFSVDIIRLHLDFNSLVIVVLFDFRLVIATLGNVVNIHFGSGSINSFIN